MAFSADLISGATSDIIILRNNATGNRAEIFSFGALLNAFEITRANEKVNVIDGYNSPEDAMLNITKGFKSARLSPFVCRIKNSRYHFGEGEYMLNKYTEANHALHGLLYDQLFSVMETGADDSKAFVRLHYNYDNLHEGYPFKFVCEVSYVLEESNTLHVTTRISNADNKLMPVADGWHHYFNLTGTINECQLEFQSKEMLLFDNDLMPTGESVPYQLYGSLKLVGNTAFDNCFLLDFTECQPLCVFRNPKKKIQVQVYPSPSYPYLQVYTPPHRRSIAIENLSAPPDSFNNAIGLHVLTPGQTVAFDTKFAIKTY